MIILTSIEEKDRVNQILISKHVSRKELINSLYSYIATTGRIPFVHQSRRNKLANKLTYKLSKLPHKSSITTRKQYNKWVNSDD